MIKARINIAQAMGWRLTSTLEENLLIAWEKPGSDNLHSLPDPFTSIVDCWEFAKFAAASLSIFVEISYSEFIGLSFRLIDSGVDRARWIGTSESTAPDLITRALAKALDIAIPESSVESDGE